MTANPSVFSLLSQLRLTTYLSSCHPSLLSSSQLTMIANPSQHPNPVTSPPSQQTFLVGGVVILSMIGQYPPIEVIKCFVYTISSVPI
jgi:hypothetical protein